MARCDRIIAKLVQLKIPQHSYKKCNTSMHKVPTGCGRNFFKFSAIFQKANNFDKFLSSFLEGNAHPQLNLLLKERI